MIFKPGDVVKLKSGSQLMTVEKSDDKMTHTVWFELIAGHYQGNVFDAEFATESLEEVPAQ